MIFHSDPDGHALKKKLDHVIGIYDTIDTSNFHQRVQKLFSWKNVAERTEKVYDKVRSSEKLTMLSKLKTGRGLGEYAGWFSIWLELLNFVLAFILEFWFEIDQTEVVDDFPYYEYKENKSKFGDHEFVADPAKQKKSIAKEEKEGKYMTSYY